MDAEQLLFSLSGAVCGSGLAEGLETVGKILAPFAEVTRQGGSLLAELGNGEPTILLDAHIDEIGFVVTRVEPNGFVRVANVGGIDCRMLPAASVVLHGKREISGVFCTLPPHLTGEEAAPLREAPVVDTGLADAAELLAPGDRVTFAQAPAALAHGRITGKALDNRAGCAALILAAEQLASAPLPCRVCLLFSDQEETGGLGAKIAAYSLEPDLALVVDVSFADGPGIPEEKCGVLGGGPMLGIAPLLSAPLTARLCALAEERGIPLQREAMGGKTGTNADEIARVRAGIPCGLLSIPLRNMHTPVEVVQISDVTNTAALLAAFCRGGGRL